MIQKFQAPVLMYGDKVLGAATEGTTSFAAEDTASNENNQYSRPQMSFSANIKTTKAQARELRRLLYPLNRPQQVSPRKKVAWRLVRKWFNRYEKPRLIGSTISLGGLLSQSYNVTDVHITPGGRHTRNLKFNLKPKK